MYGECIEQALKKIGAARRQDADKFVSEHRQDFEGIDWAPRYLFEVEGALWGFSIFSGEKVPHAQLEIMCDCQSRLKNFKAGFFVPEERDPDIIASACAEKGIALIAKTGPTYQLVNTVITFPTSKVIERRLRIPLRLIERTKQLELLEPSTRGVLRNLACEHNSLCSTEVDVQTNEEALVKSTFSELLGLQPLLTPTERPADMMRMVEKVCQHSGFQDHYFHTLQNLLLGSIVINECRGHFVDFLQSFFGTNYNLLPEHIWVLTAIFHDVGYCIERKDEFDGEVTGVRGDMDFSTGAPSGISDATQVMINNIYLMDSEGHARNQMVHLFDYLNASAPQGAWQRNPRHTDEHPFRGAIEDNFMSARHGAHSAFRLLREVFPLPSTPSDATERECAIVCAFLAAISIPFHDRAFRAALRKVGISSIATSRFPFAALLAFIDSIQDDRREPDVPDPSKDILEGLEVHEMKVTASLDLTRLTDGQILKKRREAADIAAFFSQDGLSYEFPRELLD
ncbi:MAG: hypothetical protein WBC82_10480 [Dehalococcoidia bacterium]